MMDNFYALAAEGEREPRAVHSSKHNAGACTRAVHLLLHTSPPPSLAHSLFTQCSVFTGEFACCRLGHKRKSKTGELMTVTCDKTRIRPLVRALWDRKIAHLATLPPFIRWMFHWRWASHTDMMMSDWSEDVEDSTDQTVHTLEDMAKKYIIDEPHRQTYHALMGMFKPMFLGHPSLAEPDDTPVTGGGGSVLKPQVEVSKIKSKAARPHDASPPLTPSLPLLPLSIRSGSPSGLRTPTISSRTS